MLVLGPAYKRTLVVQLCISLCRLPTPPGLVCHICFRFSVISATSTSSDMYKMHHFVLTFRGLRCGRDLTDQTRSDRGYSCVPVCIAPVPEDLG